MRTWTGAIAIVTAACVTLLSVSTLAAETPTGKGNSGTASVTTLEDVIVTAQKRDERLKDVPISISVISGADLEKSSVFSVTDALTQVPGVIAATGVQSG